MSALKPHSSHFAVFTKNQEMQHLTSLSFDLLLRLSTEAKTPSLRKYLPMCSRWRRSGNECWWFNSWKLHWVNSTELSAKLAYILSHFCPSLLGLILIYRIISIPFGVSWRMSATITSQLLDVIPIPLGPLKMDVFGHLWLVKDFHPLLISALKNCQYEYFLKRICLVKCLEFFLRTLPFIY